MRQSVLGRLKVFIALLLLGLSFNAFAATSEQKAQIITIEKNLRCPLCDTGEPIADSRSDISIKMRESVRQQVLAGKSEQEIYAFFAQRYGDFVLLDPPKTGRNLLLWGTPLAAFLLGGFTWWSFIRRANVSNPAPALAIAPLENVPVSENPVSENEEVFDTYLQQVKQDTRARADQARTDQVRAKE